MGLHHAAILPWLHVLTVALQFALIARWSVAGIRSAVSATTTTWSLRAGSPFSTTHSLPCI
jgi:hypothetical protein